MSNATVSVRAYNVRFGDCVLISFTGDGGEKHILCDFGNAPSTVKKSGGKNDVYLPIAKDIKKRTGGKIDLLIMTHEHLDHMEGFLSTKQVFDCIDVSDVWMSIMSEPDYYDDFPNCKKQKFARLALSGLTSRWDERGYFNWLPEGVKALLANNVLSISNPERIQYVREMSKNEKGPYYLNRGVSTSNKHKMGAGCEIEILAPEKDASVYYRKRGDQFWLDLTSKLGGHSSKLGGSVSKKKTKCPSHMAKEEFEQLKEDIAELDLNDLLAIDKAANNTSLVVKLKIAGKTLLLAGDAEQESWAIMKKKGLLAPVDFLKVAHHGSINGMPFTGNSSVVDLLLKPRKRTKAVVSTCRGVYGKTAETEIPCQRLMDLLYDRCELLVDTEKDLSPGSYWDIDLA